MTAQLDTHTAASAAETAMLHRLIAREYPACIRVTRAFEGKTTHGLVYPVISWEKRNKPRVKGDDGRECTLSPNAWEAASHAPSAADISSAAECAAAGQHLTATDVTGRKCCVVCGRMG